MLVIKLKGKPTLGNLEGPWEASITNKSTWNVYADHVAKMVKHFGSDTMPDDILRFQAEAFLDKMSERYASNTCRVIRGACSSFYGWMIDMGFAETNPFRGYGNKVRTYNDVRVIV
jgi:hypothetical protein